MKEVVVVDYGSGNTFSMLNALEYVVPDGRRVALSCDPRRIADADRIVLPGVGAFAECRHRLDKAGVLPAITAAVDAGRPFLGVCVGMQILANEGREFGVTPGLGWIPGVTRKLQATADGDSAAKLPHVGWSTISVRNCELLSAVREDDYFYFVHSFTLECADRAHVAAEAEYCERFAAAVINRNIFGCQFHPEKSAQSGLRVLEAFCRWNP